MYKKYIDSEKLTFIKSADKQNVTFIILFVLGDLTCDKLFGAVCLSEREQYMQ